MTDRPFPEHVTIGQKYEPAMTITDQAEADAYFDRCVRHTMRFGKSEEEAARIERINLGYFAGYYSLETRERVERLFLCEHPVFGKIATNGPPTSDAALVAGVRMGIDAKAAASRRRL